MRNTDWTPRSSRMTRKWRAIVAIGAAMLLTLAPARAGAQTTLRDLTLPAALALLPDTPAIRAAGVWYANYALAARIYGVEGVASLTDARIARYFDAIVALRPGPETGTPFLTMGRWRQQYGYDLFGVTGEIYTSGGGTPTHPVGALVGHIDPAYIAHVLAVSGYTHTLVGPDRFFVQSPTPPRYGTSRVMNAVAIVGGRVIAGAWPAEVLRALVGLQQRSGSLGQDAGYGALAEALGPVQGAYLAANVPPSTFETSPFSVPPGGHRGARLHSFSLYATAYQEPSPGRRYMEIALAYARSTDALADAPTLRARLQRESLAVYGVPWRQLVAIDSIGVHDTVLVARLRLAAQAPPTLWQDVIVEGDLSIVSR